MKREDAIMMRMGKDSFFLRKCQWSLWGILLAISLFLLMGCVSHIKDLRDVQDQFNNAATLENQMKMDPRKGDAVTLTAITASYSMSLKSVSELIENKQADLEKDKLLGVAYTIKALAAWRLGDFQMAEKTATTAINMDQKSKILLPRDRAMLGALRGLMKNDQAYLKMKNPDSSYGEIKTLLMDSISEIQAGMTVEGGGENLRLYFLTSQMSALRNWKLLRTDPPRTKPQPFDEEAERKEWCNQTKPIWGAFEGEVHRVMEMEEAGQFIRWWGLRLGMPQGCP